MASNQSQIVPKFRDPIRDWKPYKVNATYLQQEDDLRDPRIADYVPLDTGFGTTHEPDKEENGFGSTYAAWALYVIKVITHTISMIMSLTPNLISGFLLIFPWLGAMFFYNSRSRLARLAAILSIIFLPFWLGIIFVYLQFGQRVL